MSKSKKANDSSVAFHCEWHDCDSVFNDLALFLPHVKSHCDKVVEECNENDNFCCYWDGCNEEQFEDKSSLYLHVGYHGFHTKLMSIGTIFTKSLAEKLGIEPQCFMDNTTRTVLPELPVAFICGWNNCYAEYVDAEAFYRHVETHPFDISIPSLSKEALKASKFAKCCWQECTSAFSSRSHLKDHLKSHSQEKVIACPNCGAMFSAFRKFCDHLLRQMDMEEKQIEAITVQVSTDDVNQQYTVTLQVEKAANDDDSLEVSTSFDGDNEFEPQEKRPSIGHYYCDHCDRKFRSKTLLREHSRRHCRQYKCDNCGHLTDSPSSLRHHILYRHSDERPFACQFCDSKFKSRSDLRKHIDIHNEESPFKCNLCSFECRCCHTLSKHQKQDHQSSNSEYFCDECKKKFSRGNNLTRHLITIHGYALRPGQSRFIYTRQADGYFHLDQ